MSKKLHKPGNKGRQGGAQPGSGAPKREISPGEMKKAEQLAFEGNLNGTICEEMNWSRSFLFGRKDLCKRLTKKRAQRKIWLHRQQNRTAAGDTKSAAAMQIFLGKNELEQTDKVKAEVTTNILDVEGLKPIGKE